MCKTVSKTFCSSELQNLEDGPAGPSFTQVFFEMSFMHEREEGRVCKRCEIWKPLSEFEKLKRNKCGYRIICKPCRVLEPKTNTRRPKQRNRPPDGITLKLKLKPDERFWRGFNRLMDMMADQVLNEYKQSGRQSNR